MILTTAITWAILATGGAIAVYLLMRREVSRARAESDSYLEAARDIAKAWREDIARIAAEREAATARADHYASSWGRIMRKLRFAEKANKDLRTELVRRQTAERDAA